MILHPGNLEDLNNVQSGVYGTKSQIQVNQMGMRVWGVMSHKAACAIETVQGG